MTKKVKKKVKKVTSKDLPGNGLLKKAGEAMEQRQKRIEKQLRDAGL